MVEPEMRPAAFGACECGGRKNAPEQREIAYGKRALQLLPPHLVGVARSFVEAHGGHILALDPLVLRQGLPECAFLPDRTKLVVRQYAAVLPYVGLQGAAVAPHQVREPGTLQFRDGVNIRSGQIDTRLPGERCRLSAGASTVYQRSRQR